MFRRILLFRNLIDNIPKNIGLYSVGVMLLFLFHITINPFQILFGLFAFLLSYSSIYVLNDFYDTEEDMKDEKKVPRKPLARGVVTRNEAVWILFSFLTLGLLLSISLNLFFFSVVIALVFINMIYSIPLSGISNKSLEEATLRSLKHTILGLPLVFLMQLLKIFLPWTISQAAFQFPILFAVAFSLLYVILFKGYKEYLTIGESIKQTPISFGAVVVVFVLSMSMYPNPIVQASVVLYVLAGIMSFRNSHLADRRVLLLSPIYILLGILFIFYLVTNVAG